MVYRVVFRVRAQQDLNGIFDYIQRNNPQAASNWIDYLEERALSLSDNPHRIAIYAGKYRQMSLRNGYGVYFWISESSKTVYVTRVFGKGQRRRP